MDFYQKTFWLKFVEALRSNVLCVVRKGLQLDALSRVVDASATSLAYKAEIIYFNTLITLQRTVPNIDQVSQLYVFNRTTVPFV